MTEEEKRQIKERLLGLESELKEYRFYRKLAEIDLEEGIAIQAEKARRKAERDAKEFKRLIEQTEFMIRTCKEQLEKGVEIKNDKTTEHSSG